MSPIERRKVAEGFKPSKIAESKGNLGGREVDPCPSKVHNSKRPEAEEEIESTTSLKHRKIEIVIDYAKMTYAEVKEISKTERLASQWLKFHFAIALNNLFKAMGISLDYRPEETRKFYLEIFDAMFNEADEINYRLGIEIPIAHDITLEEMNKLWVEYIPQVSYYAFGKAIHESLPEKFQEKFGTDFTPQGVRRKMKEMAADLAELKELSAKTLPMLIVPPEIGILSGLQTLRLEDCAILIFPSGAGQLLRLEELSLRKNLLFKIPDSIAAFKNLKRLCLSHNRITSLPTSLSSLKQLQHLDISQNDPDLKPPAGVARRGLTINADQSQYAGIFSEVGL